MFVKTAKSVSGKPVRLTEERWQHICERHPEVTEYIDEILETVSDPEIITKGWINELIAIKRLNSQDIAVIYKENLESGFIITAFFTRSREYFEKRGIVWSKQ